jgi:hypothetical protein
MRSSGVERSKLVTALPPHHIQPHHAGNYMFLLPKDFQIVAGARRTSYPI